jgi:uncharacterized membrane protein YhaH (DUF805 family)
MKYYLNAFRHCFDFKGRTSRKDYWMFVLFNFVITIVLDFLPDSLEIFSSLYVVIIIIPYLSIEVRRLHDVNKSGWLVAIQSILSILTLICGLIILIDLIPGGQSIFAFQNFNKISPYHLMILSLLTLIFGIYIFILKVKKGDEGENKYGFNPELVEDKDNDKNTKKFENKKTVDDSSTGELKPLN